MTDDLVETIRLGRRVVSEGLLVQLRAKLGLSRNLMSEFLHTSPITYSTWERKSDTRLWPQTALRIGRFYQQAIKVMDELSIPLDQLVPFHIAATLLGVPQEFLLAKYRNGEVQGVDLGILGLWMWRTDLRQFGEDTG
jgi:transcriptional regulator with XRE-family HTH domain